MNHILYESAMLNTYPSYTRLFIWQNRLLYFGLSKALTTHSYAAVALHVGIYQPFYIKIDNGEWQSCRCAIVPAGVKHELNFTDGIHGKLFIERNSADFLYFKRKFPHFDKSITLFHDENLVNQLREIYEQNPSKITIEKQLNQLLNCDNTLTVEFDSRVQKAVTLICDQPNHNFSQEYLAVMNELSPSRFLHLFKENTGVPYRRFRAWRRLFLAVEQLNKSDNMTFAALEAGFADATHFSHSFKNTFGVNPAFVFRDINRFEIE